MPYIFRIRKSGLLRKGMVSAMAAALFMACAVAKPHPTSEALIQASRKGDTGKVLELIKEGADINAQDAEGWTPYLAASAAGKWEIMRILQGMGAKTDPGF